MLPPFDNVARHRCPDKCTYIVLYISGLRMQLLGGVLDFSVFLFSVFRAAVVVLLVVVGLEFYESWEEETCSIAAAQNVLRPLCVRSALPGWLSFCVRI